MKNLILVLTFSIALLGQSVEKNSQVTPVAGESWLSHLHRPLAETSMGKTGRLGPLTTSGTKDELGVRQRLGADPTKRSVTLQGSDLYRLNCQGCHGELGQGAPPEINSVINPTRATSVALIIEKMTKIGMEMSQADAAQLANQSKTALLERLHHGGTDMPPFPHLSEAEVHAIFRYLRQLAEVPGAQRQQAAVEESPVRVGEHIVKSTCHICHSAAGPNPSLEQLLNGAIPPLSSLTSRTTLPEFERKIRNGAPILMGAPPSPYRGRMPVFYYLSENEVADAYLYLKLYPPYEWAVLNGEVPTAAQNRAAADKAVAFVQDFEPPKAPPQGKGGDMKIAILPAVAEIFVALLLAGGLVFTGYEVKRLSAESKSRKPLLVSGVVTLCPSRSASSEVYALDEEACALASLKNTAADVSDDRHRRGANPAPFHNSDHRSFESSWLARRFEGEDWVA